jgi:hypothetical protein
MLLSEDTCREVFQYFSYKEVSLFRPVNVKMNQYAGAYLLSGILKAKKMMTKEQKILKSYLARKSMKGTDLKHFLSHRFGLLESAIYALYDTYKKYIGTQLYPVVRGKVGT